MLTDTLLLPNVLNAFPRSAAAGHRPVRIRRLPVLMRVLEANAAKPEPRKAFNLSRWTGGDIHKLSWEGLHLSDALEESEELHKELRKLFVTQLVVRLPAPPRGSQRLRALLGQA